jgi:hypothetical protein
MTEELGVVAESADVGSFDGDEWWRRNNDQLESITSRPQGGSNPIILITCTP